MELRQDADLFEFHVQRLVSDKKYQDDRPLPAAAAACISAASRRPTTPTSPLPSASHTFFAASSARWVPKRKEPATEAGKAIQVVETIQAKDEENYPMLEKHYPDFKAFMDSALGNHNRDSGTVVGV